MGFQKQRDEQPFNGGSVMVDLVTPPRHGRRGNPQPVEACRRQAAERVDDGLRSSACHGWRVLLPDDFHSGQHALQAAGTSVVSAGAHPRDRME